MKRHVLATTAAAALVLTAISFSTPRSTRAQTSYGAACLTIHTYDSYSVRQCINESWTDFTTPRDYCSNFSAHTMGASHSSNFMIGGGFWTDGASINWEGDLDLYQSEIGTCD